MLAHMLKKPRMCSRWFGMGQKEPRWEGVRDGRGTQRKGGGGRPILKQPRRKPSDSASLIWRWRSWGERKRRHKHPLQPLSPRLMSKRPELLSLSSRPPRPIQLPNHYGRSWTRPKRMKNPQLLNSTTLRTNFDESAAGPRVQFLPPTPGLGRKSYSERVLKFRLPRW